MTERKRVIVIGAGHNGLVTAAYLARAELETVVVEAAAEPGGMAAPLCLGDIYHFPGLAALAYPVAPELRDELDLDDYGYTPGTAVDTVALAADGRHLTIGRDRVSGEGLSQADADSYPAFRQRYLEFAAALQPLLKAKPPRLKGMDLADTATLAKLGWQIRKGLGREAMYEFLRVAGMNIYDVLDEAFDDDRLKGAIAAEAVMGSAMGPRSPGTVWTWLQWLQGELNGPLTTVRRDQAGLIRALVAAAEAAGASIRCNARVERILVDDGVATGVVLADGEVLSADLVVSSADPRATFTKLVGAPQLDAMFASRVSQVRGAGVVSKILLALADKPVIDGVPEEQLGSRFLVAPTMRYVEQAFNHSKYGECSDHFVLDFAIPSIVDESLAPAGRHFMSINVAFTPYALEAGWDNSTNDLLRAVLAQLGEFMPGLEPLILHREVMTPRDIESRYHAVAGHWHHGELSLHQSFMLRPVYGAAQHDTPIDNLFLCGAGCHPGGGLTGLPGRNAAKRILKIGARRR